MKKVLKHILPIILSVLLCFGVCQTPVYASGSAGNGTSGEGSEGEEDLDGKDGASLAKSLFIIYTSDANGNPTSPVVVRSYLGNAPSSTSGASLIYSIHTRFGAPATQLAFNGEKIAWGLPAFTNSGGTGEAIKNWLLNPVDGFETGTAYVLQNYLGYSEDACDAWFHEKDVYLNYDAIPANLSRNASRYVLSSAREGARSGQVRDLLPDMISSYTVNIAYHANNPEAGMALEKDAGRYKLFTSDVGLFVTLAFRNKNYTENTIYNKLLSDKLEANLGYVYENVVAQMSYRGEVGKLQGT